MLLVQSVWEGVKPKDRVLYIFPDLRPYLSSVPSVFLKEFRKTLQLILKVSPSYVVGLFPHPVSEFIMYEELYGMEFQEIDSIHVFEETQFQSYLNPHKLYYLNQPIRSTLESLTECSFDQIIVDDLEFSKDDFEYLKENQLPYTIGKNYSEEIINSKMYLGKMIQQILHPFRSPFEQTDSMEESNDYDVVLIFGNHSKLSIQEYEPILMEYMKACRLSAIYTCDKDLLAILRSWIQSLKIKIPTYLFPIQWTSTTYPSFIKKIKAHSCRYTSFLWIGSFDIVSKDVYSKWVADREKYKHVSVFDLSLIHI